MLFGGVSYVSTILTLTTFGMHNNNIINSNDMTTKPDHTLDNDISYMLLDCPSLTTCDKCFTYSRYRSCGVGSLSLLMMMLRGVDDDDDVA